MIKVNSVSGGKTSAYIMANYEADYNLFSLVRIEDKKCLFPDKKIRQIVEDKINLPFVGTAEDDTIIYTMLDLEQFLGKKITWVSGETFDQVIKTRGGWLPNKLHRYCTTYLKIDPMFKWWYNTIRQPIIMRIGYRANEVSRMKTIIDKLNENGLLEYYTTIKKHTEGKYKGKNKWEFIEWQKPTYPLISANIYKDTIVEYWKDKPVRFAQLNNCVGCFHRNPMLLRLMYEEHPQKINWFAKQEGGKKGTWRSDIEYSKIIKHNLQSKLSFDDFNSCDSGYCENN
jgi:hypothetical protein